MHHDRHHSETGEELRDQLTQLSQDVVALKKQMARRSRSAYSETRDMGEDFTESMRDYLNSMPDMRQQAYRLQRSAQAHPGTTAVIAATTVIILGLAASLFARR